MHETYICYMGMAKLKPHRIMIFQKHLLFFRITASFAWNLQENKNSSRNILKTTLDSTTCRSIKDIPHKSIYSPPYPIDHDTWHHRSIHESREQSKKQCHINIKQHKK